MAIKSKTKPLIISSPAQQQIVSDRRFPKPICLEECNISVKSGYEKYVFKSLKSFSDKNEFEKKNPHDVTSLKHKIQAEYKLMTRFGAVHIFSLDVKSRADKYRLLYCFDKEQQVYKILTLCTDKTHSN